MYTCIGLSSYEFMNFPHMMMPLGKIQKPPSVTIWNPPNAINRGNIHIQYKIWYHKYNRDGQY